MMERCQGIIGNTLLAAPGHAVKFWWPIWYAPLPASIGEAVSRSSQRAPCPRSEASVSPLHRG